MGPWNHAEAYATIRPMNEQQSVFPVISVSGSLRVGSMWSFNVARALAREAGLNLIPDRVPSSDAAMIEAADLYLKSRPTDTRCVIKIHLMLPVSPTIKVIRNTRDLRDRLFSHFRFMKIDFDERLVFSAISDNLKIDSYYDQWPAEKILNIPFESIGTNSAEVIRQISEFVGLPEPDVETIKAIDYQFSKSQVRKRISEIEDHVFDQEGSVKQDADSDYMLERGPGQIWAYDIASGFQSGHVSDYQPGDWKHLWTDRQKQIVDNAISMAQQSQHTAQRSNANVAPVLPHVPVSSFQRLCESLRIQKARFKQLWAQFFS